MIKKIIESINNDNIIEKFKTLHNMIELHDTGINTSMRSALEAILKYILEIEHNSFPKLIKQNIINSSEILKDKKFREKITIEYGVNNNALNAFWGIIYDGNKAIHESYNSFEKNKIKDRYKHLILLIVKILNIEGKNIKLSEKKINEEFEEIYNDRNQKQETNKLKIEINQIILKDQELQKEYESLNSFSFLGEENLLKIYELLELTEKYIIQINSDSKEIIPKRFINLHNCKQYIESMILIKNIEEKVETIAFEILNYKFDILEELANLDFTILNWFYIPKTSEIIEKIDGKEQIAEKIDNIDFSEEIQYLEGRYYVNNIKPFFVGEKRYFEIQMEKATNEANNKNNVTKVFTTIKIRDNYSVKLKITKSKIKLHGIETEINILVDYYTSIRPAEISKLIYILTGEKINNISKDDKFYQALNKYIDKTKMNLLDIVLSNSGIYEEFLDTIRTDSKMSSLFIQGLENAQKIIKEDKYESGANILRYLLAFTKLKVLKAQSLVYITAQDLENGSEDINVLNEMERNRNNKLLHQSKLFIVNSALQFDRNPFSKNLKSHRTLLKNLRRCIDLKNREHDIFARYIDDYCSRNQCIFVKKEELYEFGNIEKLIESYNSTLTGRNARTRLELIDGYVYIYENVDNILKILNRINALSDTESNFQNIKNEYFSINDSKMDISKPITGEQKEIIDKVFNNSRIMFLYGEAGTGKTEMMCNYLTRLFDFAEYKINYIANTHSAKFNLKRRVKNNFELKTDREFKFMTVSKYNNLLKEYDDADVLIIDECKTIPTTDIKKILDSKIDNKKYIIFAGDIGQTDSIGLGNWFSLAKILTKKESHFELRENLRTDNAELFKLWKKVRNQDQDIINYLKENNYTEQISNKIFENREQDEVIICWNYNGFYGINSINSYFQNINPNKNEIVIGMDRYKKGDPIVFNKFSNTFAKYESDGDILYNNLKGIIKWVESKQYKNDKYLEFKIEIKEYISEDKIRNNRTMKEIFKDSGIYQIEYEGGNPEKQITIITIRTRAHRDWDSNEEENFVDIPFNVAYAMSLHKAQGLEFDSVKVIVTPESEELFDNESFYTAITRAKKNLKIYFTTADQDKILNILSKKTVENDAKLLLNF